MNTPIYDFVKKYKEVHISRLHMPGHKGQAFLGCEDMDITEIAGADVLSMADGITTRIMAAGWVILPTACGWTVLPAGPSAASMYLPRT